MSFLFLSSWSPYHLSVSLLLLLLLFFFLFSPLLRFPFLLYHPLQTQKDIKTVIWNFYCKSFPLIPLCCHFHSFWCHEFLLFFKHFTTNAALLNQAGMAIMPGLPLSSQLYWVFIPYKSEMKYNMVLNLNN